jgi:hypothetical protein
MSDIIKPISNLELFPSFLNNALKLFVFFSLFVKTERGERIDPLLYEISDTYAGKYDG